MLSKEGHSRAPAPVSKPQFSNSGPQRLVGRREPILTRGELDADPTRLRENLEELAVLLRGSTPRLRRRVPQMFGELVALWQGRLEGPISVVIEFLPHSVRMSLRSPQGTLPPTAWEQMLSPIVLDLIDSWGIDPGTAGSVWFEFLDDRTSRVGGDASQPRRSDRAAPQARDPLTIR
jgi:hypothetical protein